MLEVADAARHLGVSERRVRAMLAAGRLPGERRRSGWVIPARAVINLSPRGGGRPMSPPVARACLALISGREQVGLDSSARARLERRMRDRLADVDSCADVLAAWCVNRADQRVYRALPPVVEEALALDGALMGGPVASSDLPIEVPQIYLAEGQLRAFEEQHLLPAARSSRPSLVIRSVPDQESLDAFADPANPSAVSLVVSGLDVLDEGGPRAIAEGRRMGAAAVGSWLGASR